MIEDYTDEWVRLINKNFESIDLYEGFCREVIVTKSQRDSN